MKCQENMGLAGAIGICGKGNSAVCMDCIVSTLGSLTEMPCSVGNLLVQGLFRPMKWLVQPEFTTAQLLLDGLRAGNKVLQKKKLLKTKKYLILTVPCLYQGSGLQFLCVQPFLSCRKASFWCPVSGVGNFQLGWSQLVPHIHK